MAPDQAASQEQMNDVTSMNTKFYILAVYNLKTSFMQRMKNHNLLQALINRAVKTLIFYLMNSESSRFFYDAEEISDDLKESENNEELRPDSLSQALPQHDFRTTSLGWWLNVRLGCMQDEQGAVLFSYREAST